MKQSSYLKGIMILIGIVLIIAMISLTGNAGLWIMTSALLLTGLGLLYSLATQIQGALIKPAKRIYARDFSLKFLATLMGFFFVVGTLLYLYVFYTIAHDPVLETETGHPIEFSNAEYLMRSLICSLDLFMLDVDSNILDRLDRHGALKGWLTIQAAVSFACTVAMLVGLVYSRLHAYYRLNYATAINDSRSHLYLFFGNNEPSELLIRDIVKHDPKAVPVIIDEANMNEDDNNDWEGIIGLITHKRKVFRTAEKIGAYVTVASQQLDDIDNEITARDDFDAFGYLGIPKIKKFIQRLAKASSPELHIFFMGDDEELNIRNIIVLAKDSTIRSVNFFHRIYCHARYNGPNRVIQDVALKKHLDIQIVDSSHIAVEVLKLDPSCHPVNVVRTSDSRLATVDTPLKTLIVGFGEVGRDAFRFLYEFGAFVDSNDPNRRSSFDCTVVDTNLDNITGILMSSMPGVFDKHYSDGDTHIRFVEADYRSRTFKTEVLNDEFMAGVNYIVISIGDNDEAIALACRLFNKARKLREDISDLRIFVRCSEDNKVEGIQKIADHYNYGYAEGENNVPVIRIFGQPEKTYTYDLVVSNRLVEEGKIFHEKYCQINGVGVDWNSRHRMLTETGIPNIEMLRKLRRQESQEKANALHAATKMILLRKALAMLAGETGKPQDWESFCRRFFHADGSVDVEGSKDGIHYPRLTPKENEIILNLARLEHLRWNAAHELMGYVFNEDGTCCDERTMRHNCLVPWNKLDEQSDMISDWPCDYKKYDFCVVDTTIALNKNTNLQ